MKQVFYDAMEVAKTYDVSTTENGLVLYSVSFLPTKENRNQAFNYVKQNPSAMTMENTVCGAKLVEMGLANDSSDLSADEIATIWATASERMIAQAKGMITAFVNGADPRSVFCKVELVNVLKNPSITTINGENKYSFASRYISLDDKEY